MELKDKEQFFSIEGDTDRKNKLLKSDARLSEQEIGRLDSGELSIEDLDTLLSKNVKIFKYRTQITIHADFPREVENRVNGYAYLVNNKNGSVGVRYGAIDEGKRNRIARYLSYEGFRYDKNSTRHDFVISKAFFERTEANEYIAALKSRYDYNALRSLIYGSIDIYGGVVWGRYFVELSITVNAIAEKNVPEFLRLMKCKSDDQIAEIEKQQDEERRQRSEQWKKEQQEREAEEASAALIQRAEMLAEYRQTYSQIQTMPEGTCSLCVVTDKARRVVVKQFFLKKGKKVIKKFLQDRAYNYPKDYEQWNDTMPPHTAKDTSRMEDTALQKYILEGVVFTQN